MIITSAHMEVLDRDGNYRPSEHEVSLSAGPDETINLTITRSNSRSRRAEIRRSVTDPERARKLGNADSDVLLDWFLIQDIDVAFYDGTLRLRGYMSGVKGHLRDGQSPYDDDGNAYMDDDQPLAHVSWRLS